MTPAPPFAVSQQVGQEIEVRPGIVEKTQDGKLSCRPIFSRILSLFAEQNDLQFAVPGGLIGRNRARLAGVAVLGVEWETDDCSW